MSEYRDFGEWYRLVERQVRFFPDRKAIHRELADHYWDHVRDLQRVGYEPELSYQRGLRAMGDPEEVGRALDKVHSPLLGWLWMVSRMLAVLAVLAVLLTLWGSLFGYYGGWYTIRNDLHLPVETLDYEPDGPGFLGAGSPLLESDWQRTALLSGSPGEWKNEDYTVSVPYAAIWREERSNGNVYHWLSIVMQAEKRRFWDADLSLVPLYITDSNGWRYQSRHWEWDSPTFDFIWGTAADESTLLSSTYRINLVLEDGDAEAVELGYFLNDEFSIQLEFQEVAP